MVFLHLHEALPNFSFQLLFPEVQGLGLSSQRGLPGSQLMFPLGDIMLVTLALALPEVVLPLNAFPQSHEQVPPAVQPLRPLLDQTLDAGAGARQGAFLGFDLLGQLVHPPEHGVHGTRPADRDPP